MICRVCDAVVQPADRYCMQCGTTVEATDDAGAPDDAAAPPVDGGAVDGDAVTDLAMPVGTPVPADVELVACPSCGASNAVRRRRCGRCGALLRRDGPPRPLSEGADHEPDPVVEPAPEAPAPPVAAPATSTPARMRRSVVAAIVAGGILVGGGLGLAAGLGIGPFDDPMPSRVAFDRRAYPGPPSEVPQVTHVASATRPEDGRSYLPGLSADGDPATSWQAPVDEGSVQLQARFLNPTWVERIVVLNGDQADDTAYAATARVQHARIGLGDDVVLDATLLDQPGAQVINLDTPVLVQEVTWDVDGWYGDSPVAISEVRYVGWVADEEDRDAFGDP